MSRVKLHSFSSEYFVKDKGLMVARMGFFRGLGKVTNTVVGGAAKGSVKLVGKGIAKKNEKVGAYIGELGDTIIEASKQTVDSVAQFTDGTLQGVYGVVKKDSYHKKHGWDDIKDSTGRTAKGMYGGMKYTVKSAGITVNGLRRNDREQLFQGLQNLGKVVAVSALAVGVLDIVDGSNTAQAETIETRNDHLNGLEHAETGVNFAEKTIEMPNGDLINGTYPVFDSSFSVVLVEEVYLESDQTHFQIANQTLYQSIENNPAVANDLGMSSVDVQALENGVTPEGYVWHHNEQPGVLQLVEEETHHNTGHTGGREIWGAGSGNR